VNTVQAYYPRSNGTATFGSDPYPNQAGMHYYIPSNATVFENKAYVLGGFSDSATPSTSRGAFVFDPLSPPGSRWAQLSPLNYARGYVMGAVVDSFLYCCGGDTWDGTNLYARDYVERLNLKNPTGWTMMSPMIEVCDEAKAFGFDHGSQYWLSEPGDLEHKIVIAGHGYWVNEDEHCFQYDVDRDSWSFFPFLVRGCRNHAGALIPGTDSTNGVPGLWVWGGRHTGDDIIGDTSQFIQLRYGLPTAHDVGCTKIMSPAAIVDSNTVVTPACTVYNYGTVAETYNVRMKIGTFYDQTASVSSHAAGARVYVTFPDWNVQTTGTFSVSCSTELASDEDATNDAQTGSVQVIAPEHNVGLRVFLGPVGVVDSGVDCAPACSVYNYGQSAESYEVRLKIGGSYNNTADVDNHPAGTAVYVTFPSWIARPRGDFAVTCSTELSEDENPYNDRQTGTIHVRVVDVAAVAIVAPAHTVDQYDTIVPIVRVANRGTDPSTFSVNMRIGTGYMQTRNKTLAGGATDTAAMPAWIASTAGRFFVGCSLYLTGDVVPANDKVRDSVTVLPGSGIGGRERPTELKFALYGAQPNPVKGQARISYELAAPGFSRLAVYDTRGRLVRELVSARQPAGIFQVTWNCRDAQARKVTPGVYFCRLLVGNQRATSKLLVAN